MKKSFYDHFEYSMNSVGLTAPKSLFETQAKAVATVAAIVAVVDKFGTTVTVAELVGAGVLAEKLIVVGACGAAFYAGACVGALFYAIGQYSAENFWASSKATSIRSIEKRAKKLGLKITGPTFVATRHHIVSSRGMA